MKNIKIIFFTTFMTCLIFSYAVHGQSEIKKPSLELKDIPSWPELSSDRAINSGGTYVYYVVKNEVPGVNVMHVRSNTNAWERKLNSASKPCFSKDGNSLIGMIPENKLFLLQLGKDKLDTISNVMSYSLFSFKGKEYVAYQLKSEKTLVIRNIETAIEKVFRNCYGYTLSSNGRSIALIKHKPDNKEIQFLKLIDLETNRESKISEGQHISNVKFNKESTKLVFVKESKENHENSIWIFSIGDSTARKIIDNESAGFDHKFMLSSFADFVGGDENILFRFQDVKLSQAGEEGKKERAIVDVYSYIDKIPYTRQLSNLKAWYLNLDFTGIFSVRKKEIIYLQEAGCFFQMPSKLSDKIAFVNKTETSNPNLHDNAFYLLSTVNGKKMPINMKVESIYNGVSPDGKYILLKRTDTRDIYSYEMNKGSIRSLTEPLPIPSLDTEFTNKLSQRVFKMGAWIEGSTKVLICDNYDIWQIDVTGKVKPLNVTNGYGRKNRISFNLSDVNFPPMMGTNKIIAKSKMGSKIILSSYNYNTLDNDYFSLNLATNANPERLTRGGYTYEPLEIGGPAPRGGLNGNCKATDTEVYLVLRQNASESINIFTTNDFKSFKQLSSNYPEKSFNWLTSELNEFKSLSGQKLRGVLYKPQNFDPGKKYPVIFYFYNTMTQDLYEYKKPELSGAVIDIPYYVSNGYLVFTPDIEFSNGTGYAAQDAYNSVSGAANYLASKSWVDSTKMAIHGHSWGGFKCYYILTHTNRFAAAVPCSGVTDMFGSYGMPTHEGEPRFGYDLPRSEPISNNLDFFIKNSPKILADKVTTPTLIMHNEKDKAVLFSNGLSFFYSLWNFGKRVWLLQYDGEGHVIMDNEANKLDYTIRLKQFFDHYLKGAPAPVWMTRGIPAKMKGIDDGLELDNEIKTPVAGLVKGD